jgi:hypothetical protein
MTDGRYTFEDGGNKAVFEIYTEKGVLYYDYTLNGALLNKEGTAKPGETREQLLRRLEDDVTERAK